MNKFVEYFYDSIIRGNASVITSHNTKKLNEVSMFIYNKDKLTKEEQEDLKKIIIICNVLYNRTDISILPIEDGFYDLLLEKYKTYDEHFQVGSFLIDFQQDNSNNSYNNENIKEPVKPLLFFKNDNNEDINIDVRKDIMIRNIPIDHRDFYINPLSFNSTISKRTHDTEHSHPDLIGTLDKSKFVFIKEARDAGCLDDPNVKILERDFFYNHIEKGVYDPNRKINVVCELKYDGISVEADCGLEVISARSRGDTGIGKANDMTPILKGYTFKHAQCMIGEKPIGVKFEAIMTNSNLRIFNEMKGMNYKNCRTAIIGLFGSSDAWKYRDLITLVPLELDRNDVPQITNRIEEIEFLNKVFVSDGEPLRYCIFSGTVLEILYFIKVFRDEAKYARNFLDFMYDGIVVSYIDNDIREKLGRKNFINKYSMAVKFDPLEKQTIFRGYTYEIGQHGQVTPMIHYDPVEFIGTIHTKSTGSSYDRFKELDLRYGDYINVTYVNDVMPYVTKLDCPSNSANKNKPEKFPKVCPVCGTKLEKSTSSKTIYCPNFNCNARAVKRMSNMLQKLNIKGFSEASIVSLGVTSFESFCELNLDKCKEALGEANGTKLFDAITNLRTKPIPDYIIMGALGFTSIARKKWQSILQQAKIGEIYRLHVISASKMDELTDLIALVPNIGDITAKTIINEIDYYMDDIKFILINLNIVDSLGLSNENKLQIRFSGIRNKQLSELLCNIGFDVDDSGSVTKKTDILLVPYEGFTSSKVNKVSDKCKIIPIEDFIANSESYIGQKITLF